MPLYEIIKADGTREKYKALTTWIENGELVMGGAEGIHAGKNYAPGTWLEVWRREGVGE